MPPEVIDIRNTPDKRDVGHRAVEALTAGKLVVLPTETVYGLAARALDASAVDRLLKAKGRASGHPLTLAIRSADEIYDYAPDAPPLAERLARRCWPGPVTLVLDRSHPESLVTKLPAKVQQAVSPENTIGLRVSGHWAVLDVLQMISGPLVLTSANRTGQPEARTGQEAVEALGDSVDMVLDDGPSRFGEASSVVRIDNDDRMEILRVGIVPEKTLRRLASFLILFVCTGNTCRSPMAEALCRRLLASQWKCQPDELDSRGVVVMSAGVAATMGGQASSESVRVMQGVGIDLRNHETQTLTDPLVRHADVIFTMTASHRQVIVARWPEAAQRTLVLCTDGADVTDPIGGSTSQYERCAWQMEAELKIRLSQLNLRNQPSD